MSMKPWKGNIKEKPLDPIIGEVRTINPVPLWVGTTDTGTKRFMQTEEAERWAKETGKSVKLYTTAGELRQYGNKKKVAEWYPYDDEI